MYWISKSTKSFLVNFLGKWYLLVCEKTNVFLVYFVRKQMYLRANRYLQHTDDVTVWQVCLFSLYRLQTKTFKTQKVFFGRLSVRVSKVCFSLPGKRIINWLIYQNYLLLAYIENLALMPFVLIFNMCNLENDHFGSLNPEFYSLFPSNSLICSSFSKLVI